MDPEDNKSESCVLCNKAIIYEYDYDYCDNCSIAKGDKICEDCLEGPCFFCETIGCKGCANLFLCDECDRYYCFDCSQRTCEQCRTVFICSECLIDGLCHDCRYDRD